MKKLIFGIALLIGGILGMVGVIIAKAIDSYVFVEQGLTNCIAFAFAVLSVVGIYIAYKEAYSAK